jgi:hypothetical protein
VASRNNEVNYDQNGENDAATSNTSYWKEFVQTSSIHGFSHISLAKRHPAERFFNF